MSQTLGYFKLVSLEAWYLWLPFDPFSLMDGRFIKTFLTRVSSTVNRVCEEFYLWSGIRGICSSESRTSFLPASIKLNKVTIDHRYYDFEQQKFPIPLRHPEAVRQEAWYLLLLICLVFLINGRLINTSILIRASAIGLVCELLFVASGYVTYTFCGIKWVPHPL